jgi:hypothetical protein
MSSYILICSSTLKCVEAHRSLYHSSTNTRIRAAQPNLFLDSCGRHQRCPKRQKLAATTTSCHYVFVVLFADACDIYVLFPCNWICQCRVAHPTGFCGIRRRHPGVLRAEPATSKTLPSGLSYRFLRSSSGSKKVESDTRCSPFHRLPAHSSALLWIVAYSGFDTTCTNDLKGLYTCKHLCRESI